MVVPPSPYKAAWRRLAWPAFLACAAFASVALGAGCAGTPPCERNSDCVAGYCRAGECREDCVDAALDCPTGGVCNGVGKCDYGPGASGVSATATGSGGASTVTTGVGGATPGSSTTGSSTSSTGGAGSGELATCGGDGDCGAEFACRETTVGGAKRCIRACSSTAECPAGARCIDRGGKYCFGGDVGRYCTSPAVCNFACLLGQKYCTDACATGADCPNGFGCMPVGSPPVKVCVKAAAYCEGGSAADCIAPAACDLSPNLIIGGCTLSCDSASDCPRRAAPLPAWSCDGLCRRPAGVYGSLPGGYTPVEYHCDANLQPVALCNDAQHIDFDKFIVPQLPAVDCNSNQTTPGIAGDACVDSCRYQGGCGYGYGCVGVGGVGSERIGLCLPSGAGEPGATCAKHRDCAFAYCQSGKCSRDCTVDGLCTGGLACVNVAGPAVEGKSFRRCE
ncbi:MAG: hypothetical protein EXR75_11975 [Myxococcales bacterium]|nr:hypothetical protein [Myxococcales bacterium]